MSDTLGAIKSIFEGITATSSLGALVVFPATNTINRAVENLGLQNSQNGESFSSAGNNMDYMSIPMKKDYNNNAIAWKTMLHNLIDYGVEFDGNNEFFDFLETIRKQNDYNLFLHQVQKDKDPNIKNAIALFLSQKNYEYIMAEEEKFVINLLQSDNARNQEFALNAILLWEDFANKELLKSIRLSNKYLQVDLDEFLRD